MTTVNITTNPGAPWTWATATWTWADTYGLATWATAYPADYILDVDEPVAFAEVGSRGPTKLFAETLALTEAGNRDIAKNVGETVNYAEVATTIFNAILALNENINIADAAAKAVTIVKADTITVTEAILQTFTKNVAETLDIDDAMTHVWTAIRTFAETLGIAEAVTKSSVKNIAEALMVLDYLFWKGDGVIADVSIENVFLTPEQFLARFADAVPPGYTPWKVFLPGDYQYQEALVETTLQRQHESQDTQLATSSISADMPDLMDSGQYTVALTVGTETVPFNRTFTFCDEVQITGVSGAVASIPRVFNITPAGFDIQLLDPVTMARVTGVITFQAKGY